MEEIVFRAVVEVLGKPEHHVVTALKGYITKLKEDKNYTLLREEFAPVQQQEGQELWAVFADVEVKTSSMERVISFCFEYMPSSVEVVSPQSLHLDDQRLSVFLNDLQAKLHQVDMVAKQLKVENDHLTRNMGFLLKNYIVVMLSKSNLDSEQLSKLTGVEKDALEDFLDQLIDEGRVDMKEDIYFIPEKTVDQQS